VERTGLSKSEIYRRIQSGTFPAPIVIPGTRIRAFDSLEVDAWVAHTIAEARRTNEETSYV